MRLDTRGMNFAREVRRQLTDLVKRADFLPDRELAAQGSSGKRKRDDDGDFPTVSSKSHRLSCAWQGRHCQSRL